MGAIFHFQRRDFGTFFVGITIESQESTGGFRCDSWSIGNWLDEFIGYSNQKWNVSNLREPASYEYDDRNGNADDFLGGVWVGLGGEKYQIEAPEISLVVTLIDKVCYLFFKLLHF